MPASIQKFKPKIFILAMWILCFSHAKAQSHADHDVAMSKFMKFYNAEQSDSICDLFAYCQNIKDSNIWSKPEIMETKKEYGEMISFKFMGYEPGDSVRLYKTVCTKKTFCTGITIDEDKKLLTHRFHTTSPYIKKLLRKN
jgi:hypothetical protein